MIIKVRIRGFQGGEEIYSTTEDVEITSSWYTAQNYFDESEIKKLMLDEHYDAVIIQWNNKNYEFKRKLDDDQRHQEGRKKRAPRHRKAA